MAGRRNWLLIVGLAASGLFALSTESAQAQQGYAKAQGGVMIRRDALEKATWYKAPLQIDLVNDGPIVKDRRTGPAASDSFFIPVGPVAGANGASSSGSTIPAGGIRVGAPQAQFVGNNLPSAGFGSNINESRLKPGRLPNGTSTNRLAGQPVGKKGGMMAGPGKPLVGTGPVIAAQPPGQKILSYPTIGASGSGKTSSSVSTAVSGIITGRGRLLGK